MPSSNVHSVKKCTVRYDCLLNGNTQSCGHINENNLIKPVDFTNAVNKNGVKALYSVGKIGGKYVWHCICSCGKEFDTTTELFKKIESCRHKQDDARKNCKYNIERYS